MVKVRPATRGDVEACARLLALSFHDDPGTMVFEPDDARRARILPAFFRTFVAASLAEDADLVVAGDPVAGIASWFGPDRHGPSPEAMDANGFGEALEQMGPEASRRLLAMVGEIEVQHERLTDDPHLRLEFFGVEPGRQGSGIGSALIEHGHRRADELGLPCYLETFTKPNVRYYERRGYRVIGEYVVGEGVPVYGLARPPGAPPG
ncbi:MAG: GNAT family N-acetyltransferase [Chloroflexi bacterium]|nr:GNAT family N-acetyltransferase [Chloroflexota bacterium]